MKSDANLACLIDASDTKHGGEWIFNTPYGVLTVIYDFPLPGDRLPKPDKILGCYALLDDGQPHSQMICGGYRSKDDPFQDLLKLLRSIESKIDDRDMQDTRYIMHLHLRAIVMTADPEKQNLDVAMSWFVRKHEEVFALAAVEKIHAQ